MFKHMDLFRIFSTETIIIRKTVDEIRKVRTWVGWATSVVFSRLR